MNFKWFLYTTKDVLSLCDAILTIMKQMSFSTSKAVVIIQDTLEKQLDEEENRESNLSDSKDDIQVNGIKDVLGNGSRGWNERKDDAASEHSSGQVNELSNVLHTRTCCGKYGR